MELTTKYDELNAYIRERFNQPVGVAYADGGELKVSYTRHVLFKDVSVNVYLKVEEVASDTVTVSYRGALGLDMIIGGTLSFFKGQFPELAAGLHPEDGHRIRICLGEIKKAQAVVDNIALKAIVPRPESLHIEFVLKA